MALRGVVLGVLVLALASGAAADGKPPELAVIVNPKNPIGTLSGSELAEIFTASRRSWPNGQAIAPFNLPANDPARVAFDKAVLGMSPDDVGRFWIDQRIRGGARPPRQVEDAGIMLRLVAHIPGAIGYVPAARVDDSIKVVAWIGRSELVAP